MNNTAMNMPAANQPKQPLTTFHYLALVLLIILASIERIYGIDRQSLWSDELYAIMASYKYNLYTIWELLVSDSHPPGYVLMMYGLLPLTGYSDFGIRLHAFIYGILWIPLIFWLGRRWFSANTGLLAAALMASSYTAIYYSQEARAYTMLVTFCLGNLICFLEILFAKKIHRGYISGFIISSILILYLHYSGFVFFAAEGLLYLILHVTRGRKGALREMLLIFGIPLLFYSPWIGYMFTHLGHDSASWAVSAIPTPLEAFYTFQRLWGPDYHLTLFYFYSLAIAAIFAFYHHIKHGFSRKTGIIYTLLFLLFIPVLAFYIESQIWTPIFGARYLLMTLPLAALLVAIVGNRVLESITGQLWRTITMVVVLLLGTAWLISTNIDKKLYTVLDKDPFREAVAVVKADLGPNIGADNYTIVMTHNEFEHYLKRADVRFDNQWQRRKYAVSIKVGEVDKYLQQHPNINTFYYLTLTQPHTKGAVFALKNNYKLLSSVTFPYTAGDITVFKFSAKEAPDEKQIENAGTSITNEAIKGIAGEVRQKDNSTYTTLMSHDWMEMYLRRNGMQVDTNWPDRKYDNVVHFYAVSDYLQAHPAINTLYYFVLRDPNIEMPVLLLESQYQLVSKRTTDIPIGKLDIYKFNTKATPVITAEQKRRAANDPNSESAAWIGTHTHKLTPQSYAVITSHKLFEPYLQLNGVAVNKTLHYDIDLQLVQVLDYIAAHPKVTELYYMALRNADTERAAALLQSQYQLLAQHTTETALGKIDTFRLDTGKTPANKEAIKAKLSGSALSNSAAWLAKDAGKTPDRKYTTLITHNWFQPFLQLHDVNIDKRWGGRLIDQSYQLEAVQTYLKSHPEITTVYYVALLEPNNQGAVDAFKKQARLSCQKLLTAPNLGTISIMKFNVKETPSGSNSAVPACPE